MSVATVSAKGWVVIPAEVRRKYGLRPGDKVNIVDYGGGISILPVPSDPIRQGRGLLKGRRSLTEALLESRAEERRLEDAKYERLRSR
jgi:AbrB family looped-hinge helix DNA binding protein